MNTTRQQEQFDSVEDTLRARLARYLNPWTVEIRNKAGKWYSFAYDAPITLQEAEDRVETLQVEHPLARFRVQPWMNNSQAAVCTELKERVAWQAAEIEQSERLRAHHIADLNENQEAYRILQKDIASQAVMIQKMRVALKVAQSALEANRSNHLRLTDDFSFCSACGEREPHCPPGHPCEGCSNPTAIKHSAGCPQRLEWEAEKVIDDALAPVSAPQQSQEPKC